jgi:3-deoxy-D-manno-octulosonic-acid transferase
VHAFYTFLIYLLRPVALAIVLWRGIKDRTYWAGLAERFGFAMPAGGKHAARTVWVHAVSLGEVTAAAPLIRALLAIYPAMKVVLTTATPTGRARARTLFGEGIAVQFLPYDTPGSMRRVLMNMRPLLTIIMETELWPNLFDQCRRRGVPIVLANARLSQKSVTRYRRFGVLFRAVFVGNTFVAAQSAMDAERFIAIGADPHRTSVMGNLKFDIEIDRDVVRRGRELRTTYGADRPVWIAGSTHAGEEADALAAHARLQSRVPDALLLLVPRHPDRFEAVADLMTRRGVHFERRSSRGPVGPGTDVLLVDSIGELAMLYASADVAFVGGSLVPVGGHNLLEPAALGIPIVTGPYQSNAAEIAQFLFREGAALQVADASQLAAVLEDLFTHIDTRLTMGAKGQQVVESNRGSLQRLLGIIEPLLQPHSAEDPRVVGSPGAAGP